MRRTVALMALAALSWSQMVALRCYMGAPTPMLEATPRTFASVHPAGDSAHRSVNSVHYASAPAHHTTTYQPGRGAS